MKDSPLIYHYKMAYRPNQIINIENRLACCDLPQFKVEECDEVK
jgi:hypothetical protein